MIDLLVVGAGPAGLATSIFAASAGLEVVVLDQRAGPIDKACGEGLMPGAVSALAAAGVRLTGRPFHGIRYVDHRRSATAFFPAGSGMGVRRPVLQEAMTDRAVQLGVRFAQAAVTDVVQDGGGVTAGGRRARYLAAADGLHSSIRRLVGLAEPARGVARWGLRQHFRLAPWTRLVEVHWAGSSEAYVTPVGSEEVGVAVLGSRRQSFAEQLEAFPALRSRLHGAAVTSGVRGAGPLRQRTSGRVVGRVMLVGDAAGYVDALTGEGIAVSLACARSLVRAVLEDRPTDYERAWRRDTRRYRWMTETLLAAGRTARGGIVPAAALLPDVFRVAVRQLAG